MNDINKEIGENISLADLLSQRCVQFANNPKTVEIIDAGIESLFKDLVKDAFRSYSDFGKQATAAFNASLPTNISKILDLEHYNALVIRSMREAWAKSNIESDMVERMTELVKEFTSDESIPKFINASDLWAAYIRANEERACEERWEAPQVIIKENESAEGYIAVGLDPSPAADSSRYSSNKESPYRCDVYLALHVKDKFVDNKFVPLEHDGYPVYDLYSGHLDSSKVLGKHIISTYTRFDKLVMALYYGGSLLVWDENPEDIYYPLND